MNVRVNGEDIPQAAIDFELNRLVRFYLQHMSKQDVDAQMELLERQAIDQAIGAKLLIEEAERLDIEPTTEDVASRMRAMIKDAGGETAFEAALASQGLTMAGVREGVRRGRRVDLLVDRIAAGVSDPTDEEVRAHFAAHRDEYHADEKVEAQHILIKPATDRDDDREIAREKIEGIRLVIEQGQDFDEMAAMHSECPSGQRDGGNLGWFARGQMVSAFDHAVFSLSVDELSEIVETRFGFHIIRKTGHEPGGPADFDDVADRVRDFLRHAKRGEFISKHVRELREQAAVEITD